MTLEQPTSLLSELTDGLCRGRICMGEIAGISPEELDALFELGAQRLDTGRHQDAVQVFAGLVSLFPYNAKHWRAYGISLHRVDRLQAAIAAYKAALLIEPDHLETQCYYGEVLLYLNHLDDAEKILEPLLTCGRPDLKKRIETLLRFLNRARDTNEPLAVPQANNLAENKNSNNQQEVAAPRTDSTPQKTSEKTETANELEKQFESDQSLRSKEPYFELEDGRTLPLNPSTFEQKRDAQAPPEALDEGETTSTSLAYHPATESPNESGRERTQTAIVPRRQLRLNDPSRDEGTAIIPGRPAHRAQLANQEAPKPSGRPEITHTAIIKRRQHLPLCDEQTQITPDTYFEPNSSEKKQ